MADTYAAWAARMKASGGVVVALPQSVFKGAKDVPAVRFPAARLEELRKAGVLPYGAPDATAQGFVYFAAPGFSAEALKQPTKSEADSAERQVLETWRQGPLGAIAAKFAQLGNVAFWLVIAALVYIAWRFAKNAGDKVGA